MRVRSRTPSPPCRRFGTSSRSRWRRRRSRRQEYRRPGRGSQPKSDDSVFERSGHRFARRKRVKTRTWSFGSGSVRTEALDGSDQDFAEWQIDFNDCPPRSTHGKAIRFDRSLRGFLEQFPADQHAADLAGAGADLVKLGVTQQAPGRIVVDIAVAAEQLDGVERALRGLF